VTVLCQFESDYKEMHVHTATGRWLTTIAALIVADFTAVPVWAETTGLEEVVVTARKRDESFRDVPMSVNVFTEQAIESAGIQKPADFIALVPNMTLVETQNAGNAFVVMRGISQARNSEPSVAVLVDGVLETNPAEFNQELFDIRQIEVLKGPQGALYGRSAIGGAIIIRTKDPADQFEGAVRLGYGNGNAKRAQVAASGPVGSSETLKYRASFSYNDTDGYLDNVYLHDKADPSKDYSGRLRLVWKPNESFSGDLRVAADRLETRALYFVIPRSDESIPLTSLTFLTPPDANDTHTPIQLNNPGENNRDLFNAALKLDFDTGHGTLTSISAYDKTKEILTGDAWDFRPAATSFFNWALLPYVQTLTGPYYGENATTYDLTQSQFLDVKAYSQELRFTSTVGERFSWIAGAYYVHTDRFISTGNMVDRGQGVFPVYRAPSANPLNPQVEPDGVTPLVGATFLADTQKNHAWAVFGDATFQIAPQLELDTAVRYDEDTRENTTDTPPLFLAMVQDPNAFSGQVRKHTWSETQPKATLRYKPTDDVTVYGGWSRGFRSGGFNQTGVGTVAHDNGLFGVNDLFNAEVADTVELGVKGQFLDRRLNAGLSVYHTKSRNGYFFVFLAANSTQNLGNLDATYKGAELELNAKVTDRFDLYANFGYTDSEITHMEDPSVIGNQAPLVSKTTLNAGGQYRQPLQNGTNATLRLDYQQIGRTWWEPYNLTSRDPVNLLDLRLGLDAKNWSVTAWSKNLTNTKYNAEYSPGNFLFRALPRRYGVDFNYHF
jgi:iron complex outermembrane receptor protein